jgi:hypothetical protein
LSVQKAEKRIPWWKRAGAFFGLLFFSLLLLGITPEKAWADGYPTPEGYDHHDYQKLVTFLEYSDGGEKNGKKINENYDPAKPLTWSGITWSEEGKVISINWNSKRLPGELDLSGCTSIQDLDLLHNNLTSLNLSGCSALQVLGCINNQLESLDVSGCSSLQELNCDNNNLTNLDVSGCSSLQELRCAYNQLASLDLSSCSSLQTINCYFNLLDSLNMSGCSSLQELDCDKNELTSLVLSGCSSLQTLKCNSNSLTSLDVSSCSSLQTLECESNQLTNLDLSRCTSLQTLICRSNKLTSLNMSGCTSVQDLNCAYNNLTFSTLPLVPEEYTYSPQNAIPLGIGYKIPAGAVVDLSEEAEIDGIATVFTWYRGGDQIPLEPQSNGVFIIEGMLGYFIRCELTNGKFPGLTLSTHLVEVVPPPKLAEIATHPKDTTVAEGATAEFNVVANSKDGGELRYKWQVSQDGAVWKNILGASDTSFTTPTVTFAQDGFQFRCQITNIKDGFSSEPVYSDSAVLSVVAKPSIAGHPQNATVTIGDTVSFAVAATAPDDGILSYQWYFSPSLAGEVWIELQDATENNFILPDVTLQSNGTRYKCQVINTRKGVSAAIESTVAVLQVIALHRISFIKPTSANDEANPVNINSGSLVLATIDGEKMSEVASVTIKIDGNDEEQISPSGNAIYYLLPANISSGKHTIIIKLTNTAGKEITESMTFHWDSYRRGFGFGRFDFGEAPAEE